MHGFCIFWVVICTFQWISATITIIHIYTFPFLCGPHWASLVQVVKNLPAMQEPQKTWVWSLGQEDPLEGGHGNPLQYSCLENPMDRGLGRLQSMRLQSVRHDWRDLGTAWIRDLGPCPAKCRVSALPLQFNHNIAFTSLFCISNTSIVSYQGSLPPGSLPWLHTDPPWPGHYLWKALLNSQIINALKAFGHYCFSLDLKCFKHLTHGPERAQLPLQQCIW